MEQSLQTCFRQIGTNAAQDTRDNSNVWKSACGNAKHISEKGLQAQVENIKTRRQDQVRNVPDLRFLEETPPCYMPLRHNMQVRHVLESVRLHLVGQDRTETLPLHDIAAEISHDIQARNRAI